VETRLDVVTPDAQNMPVLVIIGKHQFGLFVSEVRSLELILHIPDLDTHLFAFKQGIPAFLADDIPGEAIRISMGSP
jgi:hypothetical protein